MQMVAGAGPREAALKLIPLTLGGPVGAFLGGKFTVRTGKYKPLIVSSNIIMCLAMLAFAFTDPQARLQSMLLLTVAGLGLGIQFPTTMVGTQNAVPRQDIGVATATMSFVRSFGAAIGVAVLTSILLASLRGNAPLLAASLSGAEIMRGLIDGGFPGMDPATRLQLTSEALSAFRRIFLISAGLALLSLAISSMLRNETLRDRTSPENKTPT